MTIKRIIIVFSLLGLFAFRPQDIPLIKKYHLAKDIWLIGEDGEVLKRNTGKYITYSTLKLRIKDIIILIDTNNEFELDGKLFPYYRRLNNGILEFLITINDRPFKEKLLHLLIKNNQIIKKEVFPHFDSPPANYDLDKNLEYEGYLDYWESFCNGCDSVVYNPTLYYELTDTGIVLDSLTTINKNKTEYGRFYGYKQDNSLKFKLDQQK